MNNKDKIEHIMALHNGELGVTWEDPDVVTPDTIAKLDQLIQDERKEAEVDVLKGLHKFRKDGVEYYNITDEVIKERLAELTKGGNTDD